MLIVDGAGWHSSPKLAVPENIVLLKLPPYAPELNPAENIWEYLRSNTLSHQVWETYDAIVDACCDAWNGLMRAPDLIRSIATRKWAQVRIKAVGIRGGENLRTLVLGEAIYFPKHVPLESPEPLFHSPSNEKRSSNEKRTVIVAPAQRDGCRNAVLEGEIHRYVCGDIIFLLSDLASDRFPIKLQRIFRRRDSGEDVGAFRADLEAAPRRSERP